MEMRLDFVACGSFPVLRNRFRRPRDPEGFWPRSFLQAWFADTKLREELRMAVREAVGVWGVS